MVQVTIHGAHTGAVFRRYGQYLAELSLLCGIEERFCHLQPNL